MSYSPYHVVEEMAFEEPESPLHPRAHPPSSAPPPPPTPDDVSSPATTQQQQQQEFSNSSNTRRNLYKSYQHEDPLPPRAVAPPIIRHDDENESSSQSYWARAKGYWSGNVGLRPNVGLTNSYDSAVTCGQALHTTVEQLRYMLIGLCATTCIVIALTWWIRFLQLQWAKLVVSFYLAFLAFLLGMSEVAILVVGIMPPGSSAAFASISGSGGGGSSGRIDEEQEEEEPLTLRDNEEEAPLRYSQAPHRQKRLPLQDQFGFLYHPTGKFSLILFMATLCLAMGGTWEYILGSGYLLVVIAIAILGREPEFQRLYYPPHDMDDDEQSAVRPINERSASWSYYSSMSNRSATAASLLRQAVRTQVSV